MDFVRRWAGCKCIVVEYLCISYGAVLHAMHWNTPLRSVGAWATAVVVRCEPVMLLERSWHTDLLYPSPGCSRMRRQDLLSRVTSLYTHF